jgi:hypothetical protein
MDFGVICRLPKYALVGVVCGLGKVGKIGMRSKG